MRTAILGVRFDNSQQILSFDESAPWDYLGWLSAIKRVFGPNGIENFFNRKREIVLSNRRPIQSLAPATVRIELVHGITRERAKSPHRPFSTYVSKIGSNRLIASIGRNETIL